MQLVNSHNPARSDAECREAASQPANADQAFIATFNAELAHAQRDALKALREVMAETADPADDDNTRLDDDDLRTRAARFRRLSLRLRAATAILRVKPISDPTASDTKPPRNTSTSRPTAKTPNDVPKAAPHAAAPPRSGPADSTSLPPPASTPQPRPANVPHQQNSHAGKHPTQPPQRPTVAAP